VGPTSRSWLITTDEPSDRAEGQLFLAAYDRKNAVQAYHDLFARVAAGAGVA